MNLLENLAKNGLDSFSANDILIVAVIESLLQADFLPCFEVDISSILQKNVITPSRTLTFNFIGQKKKISITISIILISDENVTIYASYKSDDLLSNINQIIKKKSQILSLHLKLMDFIRPKNDHINDANKDVCTRNDNETINPQSTGYSTGIYEIHKDNTKTHISSNVLKSKTNTNDNDKWSNSLSVLRISTYDVRTYEMILRIKSVLLDPILSDRSRERAHFTGLSGPPMLEILSFLIDKDLCRLGCTHKNINKIYKENKLWDILIIKEFIDFNDSLHSPSTVSTSLPILNENTRNDNDTETLLRKYLNDKKNENKNDKKNDKNCIENHDSSYKIYKEKHIKRNHARLMLQQRIRNHEATLWSHNYDYAHAWGPSGPNGMPFQGLVPGVGPFNENGGLFGPGLNGPSGVFNGLHGPFNPLGGYGGGPFSDPLTPVFDRYQN
mmetsp:Transcript_14500/g.13977  ORF Transcript_14500/g.13977 Transcript_14500/m.13977 type:complete len:443 (-) Transcript_14500:100-1428(-)